MIDRLNGREQPRLGRTPTPIAGRFCLCGHNHLAKYRTDATGRNSVVYGTSSVCSGCDCTEFRRG